MRIKGWGQGVNKDQPAWELAPGVWSDCSNIRFNNGKAQRVGGIASVITPSVTPYFVLPYSSGSTKYVFYAGTTKAYVNDGTTETDITPVTAPAAVAITGASRTQTDYVTYTVTITAVSHGLNTGDLVSVTGLVPAAFNTSGNSITKIDVNNFSYQTTNFGHYGSGSLTYSSASYSVNYSSGGTTVPFTGGIDDKITGGNFNGVLFYNNPVDGAFYWDQTATGKLHRFADTNLGAQDALRPFRNYLFLLAPTTGGTKFRHRVQWSQAADPGSVPNSFTASATNDAGFVDLVSDGEVVDGLEWGDAFYVYKRDARFVMRYIGGQFVFDAQRASGNHKDDGALAVGCIANCPKGQVFLTDGLDVRIHQGGESQSLAQGRVRQYLHDNMASTYRKRSFLCVNPLYNEVWVCYPKTGQTFPSEALIWNWESDSWGIRTLTNVTHGSAGELPSSIATDARLLIANTTPKIGLTESGYTDFGSTITSSLERIGMDFDDPSYKVISKSRWNFDGSTAFTASIYHGSSKTQDGTVTYASAATYTHQTTNWVNSFPNSGPYAAIKMTTTANDTPALVSIDLDVKTSGLY